MNESVAIGAIRRSALGRWYGSKDVRDQKILQGLGASIVLTLLWVAVWEPVQDWKAEEQKRLANAQSSVDWMLTNEIRAREVAQSRQGESERTLLPLVTRSAEKAGLALTRIQPEEEGAISIILQDQSFSAVVRWLHQIETNNGVSIERGAFDASAEPGKINAQIRLR